jgi:3-oxoacyl-[acyl-carrier-protein] synthase-1
MPALPFPVFVSGVGARSSLGLTARQTALCARARKGEPRSTRWKTRHGYFIGACTTPGVPDELEGIGRLAALAVPALRAAAPREAIVPAGAQAAAAQVSAQLGSGAQLGAGARSPSWPLFLAVPEAGRPDDDPKLDGAFLGEIAETAGLALDGARSRTFRAGHAGFALALAAAVEALGKGAGAAIVGAVDSYFHEGLLAWLDEERRVHAPEAENGFVPGEGAAFLTLSREPLGAPAPAAKPAAPGGKAIAPVATAPRVRLRAVETAVEATIGTDTPNTGQATTRLLAAMAPLFPGEKIAWALSDVNGERHRLREWNHAVLRGSLADGAAYDTFVFDLGDTGAATGALFAAMVHELLVTGAAPAANACVVLASDGADRGAFLLGLEGAAP